MTNKRIFNNNISNNNNNCDYNCNNKKKCKTLKNRFRDHFRFLPSASSAFGSANTFHTNDFPDDDDDDDVDNTFDDSVTHQKRWDNDDDDADKKILQVT